MKWKRHSILILILFAGLLLRIWHFDAIAPTNPDEGSYLRHARFLATLVKKGVGANVPVIDGQAQGIWRYVRKADWSSKPCWLHSGFIAAGILVAGETDAAGAGVNIIFSLGTVILVYLVGRRWCGEACGLTAAALLAVSYYWMLYSRSMWAEVDGVFFVVLAFYLLLSSSSSARLWLHAGLAGMFGALGVLCHYRLLYVIAPLGLTLMLLMPPRRWMRLGIILAIGYFGTLCLAAGMLRVAVMVAGSDAPFTGLVGALRERYLPGPGGVEQKGFQLGYLAAAGYYLLRYQGVWFVILCVIGAAHVFMSWRGLADPGANATVRSEPGAYASRIGLSVLVFLIVPVLVMCMQIWVLARAVSIIIPFACLLAAAGVAALWTLARCSSRARRYAMISAAMVLIVGAICDGLVRDIRFARNQMGHREAAAYLSEADADAVFVDPEAQRIYGWYAPDLPYRSLYRLYGPDTSHEGGALVVFDAQKFHMYAESTARVSELERTVARKGAMVFSTANLTHAWEEFLLDGTQAHSLAGMLASLRATAPEDIQSIRIYRMVR